MQIVQILTQPHVVKGNTDKAGTDGPVLLYCITRSHKLKPLEVCFHNLRP